MRNQYSPMPQEEPETPAQRREAIKREIFAQALIYLGLYCITYGYVYFFPTTTVIVMVMQYANTIGAAVIGGIFATSRFPVKYLYPLMAGLIFLPLVFLLYNQSALAFCLNYILAAYLGFIISTAGIMLGRLIKKTKKNMGWQQKSRPAKKK